MRHLVFLFILSFAFISCHKNSDETSSHQLEATYTGTFSRTGMGTSNVMLDFSNGSAFDGSSDHDKYPAICHGSYDLDDGTVNFTNACAWTADFDWTLILNGEYNISFPGNGLIRIWRTSGTLTDEYLLRKLVR